MTLSKELIAASAEPLVLSVLNRRDSYGYAIIKEITVLSSNHMQWSEGMLYPVLHRLEKQEFIKSYWGKSETGRKRKYYKISNKGKKQLNEKKEQWKIAHETLIASLGGMPNAS